MDQNEMVQLFQELGVFTRGHFLLSSGRHSDEYWEKFRIFEHPRVTEQLCRIIAERHCTQNIAVVIGPTTGGGLLAQEVGRQMGARCMIAEPRADGGRELRRGFTLETGTRILVVDDVLTTGLSLRETLAALRPYQPEILGIEVVIDRSNGVSGQQFQEPLQALLRVEARSYDPSECPLCRLGQPVIKPGTRVMPTQQEKGHSA